jgi:hypothetical protein
MPQKCLFFNLDRLRQPEKNQKGNIHRSRDAAASEFCLKKASPAPKGASTGYTDRHCKASTRRSCIALVELTRPAATSMPRRMPRKYLKRQLGVRLDSRKDF